MARVRQKPPAGLTKRGRRYWRRGGEAAFAESRPGALKRQARRELSQAYAPVYKGIRAQEDRTRNLDAKRASDEEAFKSWLTTTQNDILSQQQANRVQQLTLAKQHHQELQQSLQAISGGHAYQGGGPAGVGALAGIAGETALAGSSGHIQSLEDHQLAGGDLLSATAANNLALAGSLSAKRAGETSKSLDALGDLRLKVQQQQAGGRQTRLGQLLQNEIQKAQARVASDLAGAKMLNQNEQNAKSRAVTLRGQKRTNARFLAGLNRWGYSNAEWAGMTRAQKDAAIAQQKALPGPKGPGNKSGHPTASQHARFDAGATGALDKINRNPALKSLATHLHAAFQHKDEKAKGYYMVKIMQALTTKVPGKGPTKGKAGQPDDPGYAEFPGFSRQQVLVALFRMQYPHARLPKSLRHARRQGALLLPSSG